MYSGVVVIVANSGVELQAMLAVVETNVSN